MSYLKVGASRACFTAVMALIGVVACDSGPQPMTAMTYNIRFDNPEDGENAWDLRKAGLVNQLKFYEPDVFGIQEGEYHQVQYIDEALPDYAYVGVGREDGKTGGEFSSIHYDTKRLRVLEQGTFWLSDTPSEVSIGWDAAIKRVCTYARFEDLATKREFWAFNTHFDHIGETARVNSAALIRDKIAEINQQGLPVILTGDFNAEPGSVPITTLSEKFEDTSQTAMLNFGPEGTRSGFAVEGPVTRRIDFIFASPGDWDVLKYAVLSDSDNMKYYSDHLPVFAEFSMR